MQSCVTSRANAPPFGECDEATLGPGWPDREVALPRFHDPDAGTCRVNVEFPAGLQAKAYFFAPDPCCASTLQDIAQRRRCCRPDQAIEQKLPIGPGAKP